MQHSESIQNIALALSKAQGEFKNPQKNKTNPFLNNKYADIASVIDAIREPLAKYGLSVIQAPSIDGNLVTIETMLMHESGEWLSSSLTMEGENKGKGNEKKPMDIQSFAGTISYIRRYALQTVFCIAADDDDDGETGRNTQQTKPDQQQPRQHSQGRKWSDELATDKQKGLMLKIVQSHVFTKEEKNNITSTANHPKLDKQTASDWIEWLQTQSKQRKASGNSDAWEAASSDIGDSDN